MSNTVIREPKEDNIAHEHITRWAAQDKCITPSIKSAQKSQSQSMLIKVTSERPSILPSYQQTGRQPLGSSKDIGKIVQQLVDKWNQLILGGLGVLEAGKNPTYSKRSTSDGQPRLQALALRVSSDRCPYLLAGQGSRVRC